MYGVILHFNKTRLGVAWIEKQRYRTVHKYSVTVETNDKDRPWLYNMVAVGKRISSVHRADVQCHFVH